MEDDIKILYYFIYDIHINEYYFYHNFWLFGNLDCLVMYISNATNYLNSEKWKKKYSKGNRISLSKYHVLINLFEKHNSHWNA